MWVDTFSNEEDSSSLFIILLGRMITMGTKRVKILYHCKRSAMEKIPCRKIQGIKRIGTKGKCLLFMHFHFPFPPSNP